MLDLTPGKTYNYYAKAKNTFGWGTWNEQPSSAVQLAATPEPPRDATIAVILLDSLLQERSNSTRYFHIQDPSVKCSVL
jgi:hypothetical protein